MNSDTACSNMCIHHTIPYIDRVVSFLILVELGLMEVLQNELWNKQMRVTYTPPPGVCHYINPP